MVGSARVAGLLAAVASDAGRTLAAYRRVISWFPVMGKGAVHWRASRPRMTSLTAKHPSSMCWAFDRRPKHS